MFVHQFADVPSVVCKYDTVGGQVLGTPLLLLAPVTVTLTLDNLGHVGGHVCCGELVPDT